VTKTADTIAIRDLTVKDRSSDFGAGVLIENKSIDTAFKGKVTSETLNTIFEDSMFSGGSLEGDFSTHLVVDHPDQSTADGSLKGNHIPIPWGRDIPLIVQHITLEARDQGVVINSAEFTLGDMIFKAEGVVSKQPSWFAVDMDISANGIEWATIDKIIGKKDHETTGKETDVPETLPFRGQLRLQSDLFEYGRFRWEPVQADISIDGKTVLITARKAELCGISTTGTIGISKQGLKLDIALSARERSFRPTILCLTDAQSDITGVFEMEARLKGEGKMDEMIDRLEGSFSLSAKHGKILKAQQLDKTLDRLNETENLKGQFPDLDKEIIGYKVLKVRGTVGEHKIQLEEGILDSSVIGIMARGHVDMREETLDINVFVAPLKTVNKIVRMVPVLGYILGGSLVSVPVKISGEMKNPQITFLSPSAVGSEVLGIVSRTIKLPVTLVEPIFRAPQEKNNSP
jgi:hypothetical protein